MGRKKKEILHIYTRVSTKGQTTNYSLGDQKKSGIRLSKTLGMKYRVWDEGGKSGSKDDLSQRPTLSELLLNVEEGLINHLYIYDFSRLSRNEVTSIQIKSRLKENNVKLYLNSGLFDFNDPNENLMYNILSSFSQYENQIRRMKSIQGKKSMLKKGLWKGGNPPFGYDLVDRRLVENPKQSKWLKRIYEMYDKGYSTKDIQLEMLKNGVLSPRGNVNWNLGSIQHILRKTSYIGFIKQTMDGEEFTIDTPPLIDKDLWDRVRKRCENIRVRKNQINRSKHFYLLRSFMYCGDCGNPISGLIDEKTKRYYYFCSQKTRQWKNQPLHQDCQMRKSINIWESDYLVWNTICDVLEKSNRIKEDYKNKVLKQKGKVSGGDKSIIKNHNKSIQGYQKKLSKLQVDKLEVETQHLIGDEDNTLLNDKKHYEKIIKVLDDNIEIVEKKIRDKQSQIEFLNNENKWIDWLKKYGRKLDKYRKETNPHKMKEILQEFLDRIYVDYDYTNKRHKLNIILRLPLFDDELVYNDDKIRGEDGKKYKIIEGSSNKEVSFTKPKNSVDFPTKDLVLNNNNQKKIDDNNNKRQTLGHSGVVWFCSYEGYVKPYLEVNISVTSTKIQYIPKYSDYQQYLHKCCMVMKDWGWGYRKMSKWFINNNVMSYKGLPLTPSMCWSIIKKKEIRESRFFSDDIVDIDNVRMGYIPISKPTFY